LTIVPSSAEWPAGTPDSVGLDPARIGDLVARIRRGTYGTITSLLIVRSDRLVVEEYFSGMSQAVPHTMQSVSKSVTSLLAGIAIDQGRLALTDRVVDRMPRYAPIANLDARKSAMTIADLLTMRTGFDWSEDNYTGSPLQRLNNCGCDWLRFVLDWPMRDPPGTRFEYNSGGVIVLGGVIYNTTGIPADEFARRNLFEPIGITRFSWIRGGPNGLPHMGGGLSLRAVDMARIGYLVLRNGKWRERQVVPAGWLAESLASAVAPTGWSFGGKPVEYGYLWWRLPLPDAGVIYTASGAQGQWIFIIPRYDIVIAVTSNTPQFDLPVRFLYDRILPAVR
jgi:CubicO group peptidase (beta-lactamase class C family)